MVFLSVLCGLLSNLFAQEPIPSAASWPLTNPDAGGTGLSVSTAGPVSAAEEQWNNMEINGYHGPGESQRLRIAGNEWPANQTDTLSGVWVQFSVSPDENTQLHVQKIAFDIAAASIGTMKAKVYYSTDPDFKTATELIYTTGNSNNYLSSSELLSVDASVDVPVEDGETFYLRIYPWVEDPTVRTGKYVTLKNVEIAGVSEALPVESKVIWESDETFVNTGAIEGEAPAYSSAMKFYGTTELPTTDTEETVTVAAIQTVSKDWQAETDTVAALFFQYAVSPKFGATLEVQAISLYIGGWFSSNLRASIFYSKDPSFETSTPLVEDMVLVSDAVAPVQAELNVTIHTGEKLYLRIYPYNTKTEGWAKLIAIYKPTIYGSAIGVTFDAPTVTTHASVSAISTTFATSGGNISSDGGAAVTERGVVWSTTENPTLEDNYTVDGEGSGAFSSEITDLTPGTTYYVRAYATNSAGTSYGEQLSFTTLETLSPPTVTTAAISIILAESAEGGGNVSSWGGAEVTARGVVWNTGGEPTLEDNFTEEGEGLGNFRSLLHPLSENTTYYVRAYASNSEGTGYGEVKSFTTKAKEPNVLVVVAQDGSGDYTTVQAAFDAVPDFYTGKYTIYVKPGTYYEKLILGRNKVNVILRGDDPETTILTYDDYAGKDNLGTSGSYSVAIEPDDFTAINITFQNTVVNDGSFANQQAVALRVNGDRQAYYNCRILGYQDTFYAWGGRGTGRIYMKDCYIEGSVDFIFGRSIVLFDNCTIHVNRQGGVLTAAATEEAAEFGFVFLNSTITADEVGFDGKPITSFFLGRPWQAAPRTVFIGSQLPASLDPAGWRSWNVSPALYGEYNNTGPGADVSNRVAFARVLTEEEAADYTIANIFAKDSHPDFSFDWMPEEPGALVLVLKASNPSPIHEGTDIEPTDVSVSWEGNAESYKLYMGTEESSLEFVTDITGGKSHIFSDLSLNTTYFWRVDAISGNQTALGEVWSFTTSSVTGIEDRTNNTVFRLHPNFPNPLQTSTVIRYEIKEISDVTITLYDSNGKIISNLVQGKKSPGNYEFKLNNQFRSGIYYYQLSAGGKIATRKMIINR